MKMTEINTQLKLLTTLVLLCTCQISFANFSENILIIDDVIVLDSIVKIEPTCGLNNGQISIYASGSDHLFYSIDNGDNFREYSDFVDLALGDYSIVITNGLNCNTCIINTTVQLTNGPQVEITNVQVSCNEQNISGDIYLDVQNGIQPFYYNWEGPNNFTSNDENLIGVPPGSYDVTIVDNVGCEVIRTLEIPICCGLALGLELYCPEDLYLECGDPNNEDLINQWLNSASAFDGVNNSLVVENDFDNPLNTFCEDIVTIKFSTTDQCGNTTDCTANMLIADINLPTLICPEDVTINFEPGNNISNINDWLSTAGATDNCTGAFVENNFVENNFFIDCQNGSTLEVEFVALDQCDNTDICTASITINPASVLNLECTSTLYLECSQADPNESIQQWINEVTATDDFGNQTIVEHNFNFKDNYTCGEEFVVIFTSTDYCQNILQCSAAIQIVDNIAPEINCDNHLNISAYANDKVELIEEWIEEITAIDNCGDTEIENNFNPSDLNYGCGESDTQVVRFDASDSCGNNNVCLLSINIIASEITFETPPHLELLCGVNNDAEIESWLNKAKATDQFGYEVNLDNNFDIDLLNCSQATEVIFKYENPCGELFEGSSTIILIDNEGPQVTCPQEISIQSFDLASYDFDSWINEFTAEDICGDVFIYNDFDYENFNGTCLENQEVHFVAEDNCGNITECIVRVYISDFAYPEIQCPGDITIETSNIFAKEEVDAHLEKIITNTNSTLSFNYSELIDLERLEYIYKSKVVEVECIATNECDEKVSCTFNIHIDAEASIFAPTIFSPNDDGDNDTFTIYGNNHLNTVIKLSIYDRLGNRMQHLTNIPINHPSLGWDGTFQGRDCAMGVYAYHALILDIAGNQIEFVGSVTLVR